MSSYFIVDLTSQQQYAKIVPPRIPCVDNIDQADAIIVFGGDGAMLHTIHRYQHIQKPFIGINAGTRGHLMNNHPHPDECLECLDQIVYEDLWLLEAKVCTLQGEKTVYGFNDIWVQRLHGQTLRMYITIDGEKQPALLIGDGLLFSTPQGSTGYNRALRGKAISPGVAVLQMTPMACVVNKTVLDSIILPDTSIIKVDFEQISKRPGILSHDGLELPFYPVTEMTIRKSEKTVKLGFVPEYSFIKKVMSWQLLF